MKTKTHMMAYVYCFLLTVGCTNSNSERASTPKGKSHDSSLDSQLKRRDYSGAWYWKNEDSSTSFKIIIVQKNDSIFGQYCAAHNFGNRLDCDFDTVYNIIGRTSEKNTAVSFNSFYGAKNGQAIIRVQNDTLHWEIKEYPEGGDCFAPLSASLTRRALW